MVFDGLGSVLRSGWKLRSGARFGVGLGANVLTNRVKIASHWGPEMAVGCAF